MSISAEKVQSSSSGVEIMIKCEGQEEISNGNSSLENITEGKWLDEENVKFAIFMTLNKDVFKSKQKRKAEKIFKNVSMFLQSRSPRQCRSHFQKLIKKFGTVFQMKKYYRDLIGHRNFDQILENCRNQMQAVKEVNIPTKKEISVQTDFSEYSLLYAFNMEAYLQQFQTQPYYYFPTNIQETVENSY